MAGCPAHLRLILMFISMSISLQILTSDLFYSWRHSCLWLLSVLLSHRVEFRGLFPALIAHLNSNVFVASRQFLNQPTVCRPKKDNKRKLCSSLLSVAAGGNFDKLTQVCFGGGSQFQSQYIQFTKAKRLCIASKQEIKRSLIAEFDNFLSLGDPVIGRVNG